MSDVTASQSDRDASLSVYVSTDLGQRPGTTPSCDWRRQRGGVGCQNAATVLVYLAEIDDGAAEQYCAVHAEVMVGAAVTRMWKRFRGEPQR